MAAKTTEFTGHVVRITSSTVQVLVKGKHLNFVPRAVFSSKDDLQIGSTVKVKVTRTGKPDDTEEWEVKVFKPQRHLISRGETPFLREDLGKKPKP